MNSNQKNKLWSLIFKNKALKEPDETILDWSLQLSEGGWEQVIKEIQRRKKGKDWKWTLKEDVELGRLILGMREKDLQGVIKLSENLNFLELQGLLRSAFQSPMMGPPESNEHSHWMVDQVRIWPWMEALKKGELEVLKVWWTWLEQNCGVHESVEEKKTRNEGRQAQERILQLEILRLARTSLKGLSDKNKNEIGFWIVSQPVLSLLDPHASQVPWNWVDESSGGVLEHLVEQWWSTKSKNEREQGSVQWFHWNLINWLDAQPKRAIHNWIESVQEAEELKKGIHQSEKMGKVPIKGLMMEQDKTRRL